MRKLIALLLLLLSAQASGMTVANVKLEDKVHVDAGDLVLNGAGLRTKLLFKVYVAALYLREKKTSVEAILADPGAKHVELHMLRRLEAGEFMEAFVKAIKDNHTSSQFVPLSGRLLSFTRVFTSVGEVNKGDVITLDYLPALGGMVVGVNGKERGRVDGADFYRAMLKIWLGEKPVSEELKRGMLGG